jgi:hypothetical protein
LFFHPELSLSLALFFFQPELSLSSVLLFFHPELSLSSALLFFHPELSLSLFFCPSLKPSACGAILPSDASVVDGASSAAPSRSTRSSAAASNKAKSKDSGRRQG